MQTLINAMLCYSSMCVPNPAERLHVCILDCLVKLTNLLEKYSYCISFSTEKKIALAECRPHNFTNKCHVLIARSVSNVQHLFVTPNKVPIIGKYLQSHLGVSVQPKGSM